MPDDAKELIFIISLLLLVLERWYSLYALNQTYSKKLKVLNPSSKQIGVIVIKALHENFKFVFIISVLAIIGVISIIQIEGLNYMSNEIGGTLLAIFAFTYSVLGTTMALIGNMIE